MPIRKIKSEGDSEEEKVLPISTHGKPVYIPLKQILMMVLVLGFLYQTSNVYQDSLVDNKERVEDWEECLADYMNGLCSPNVKK